MSCWGVSRHLRCAAATLACFGHLSVAVQPRSLSEADSCYVNILVNYLNFQSFTQDETQVLGPLIANEIAGATGAGRKDVMTPSGKQDSVAIQAGTAALQNPWLHDWPAAASDSTLFSAKIVNPVSCNFVAESSVESPAFKEEIAGVITKRLGKSVAITGDVSIGQVALTSASIISTTAVPKVAVHQQNTAVTDPPDAWEASAPHADSATNSRRKPLPWPLICASFIGILAVFLGTQCLIRKLKRKGRNADGFLSVASDDRGAAMARSPPPAAFKTPPGGFGVTGH